mgnify:FL=1
MSPCRFTPEHPCRCGYDGEGVHRCHAGRDPRFPGVQCSAEGVPRLVPTMGSLAGNQLKVSCAVGVYCEAHWTEVRWSGAGES